MLFFERVAEMKTRHKVAGVVAAGLTGFFTLATGFSYCNLQAPSGTNAQQKIQAATFQGLATTALGAGGFAVSCLGTAGLMLMLSAWRARADGRKDCSFEPIPEALLVGLIGMGLGGWYGHRLTEPAWNKTANNSAITQTDISIPAAER